MSTSVIISVKVADLSVDPTVQRQLDARRVKRLVAEWDPKMVGVLTISRRDVSSMGFNGPDQACELVVLDGQTRWTAAREAGIEYMTAEVFDGLTPSEEASIFLKHNDRKAVTPRDRFRLAVLALDEKALTIRDIAADHGWHLQGMPSIKGSHAFAAITAAEKIYDFDNGKALRKAFDVIEKAWGSPSGAACSETLYGLGQLFGENPKGVDAPGLIHKLSKTGVNAFIAACADRRRTHPGLSIRSASSEWTKELYNRGRRTHRV